MFKYAGRILDQQDETGQMLDDLSDNAFALPEARRYPINNRDAIEKSAEYLQRAARILNQNEYDKARENMIKAASWFNFDLSLSGAPKKVATTRQQTVKEAMADFEENYSKVDWRERRRIAQELSKTAEDLTPTVKKYASNEMSENVAENIILRKSLVSDDDARKGIAQLALRAEKEDPSILIKVLSKLDSLLGLEPLYDKLVPDPVLTVMGGGKTPEAPSITLNGDKILVDDLKTVNFNNLFDPAQAMQFKHKPQTLESADPTIQEMVLKELS